MPARGCLTGLPGTATVPQKLVTRIVAKEYIPMYEMLPEYWRLEAESTGSCCQTKRPRWGLVLDIHVWVECFSVMAAILAAAYPDKAPHMFAYLRTIVRASRTFESTAWAAYDVAYRRQAANSGSLDWGILDAGLYNDAFTGRAKAIPRCTYCLADTHHARDCPDAPVGYWGSRWSRQSRHRPDHWFGLSLGHLPLPQTRLRYAGCSILLEVTGADSLSVGMLTSANTAMHHTLWQNVVTNARWGAPGHRFQSAKPTKSSTPMHRRDGRGTDHRPKAWTSQWTG